MKSDHAERYNPSNIAVKDIDFKLMHETYYRQLCWYAKGFVQQDEEDMVQDVFEILCTKRDTIYIKGKLSSYLYQSVHNNCLKRMEHIRVVRNHRENVQNMHKDGEPAHEDNNALFMMTYKEMKNKIEKIIKDMPKQRREILLLSIEEELSYKEIAEKKGVSEGTVKTQIHRAKAEILASLGLNKRKK